MARLSGWAASTRGWLATVDRRGHVAQPQALRIEETAEGATQALLIDDTTGTRLTLRFRVAAAPGALDGLAPAER